MSAAIRPLKRAKRNASAKRRRAFLYCFLVSLALSSLDTAKGMLYRGVTPGKVADHAVRYSDVDSNRHVNNTRYTAWAMDCLPDELTFTQDLREIEINFNREARPGETVSLFHAEDGGSHYVEGRVGDISIFICKLTF